ncbi:MAG: hypothetical protein C0478_10300 [Planctomyces sp.]|nr:hypothetical protein [Planctomyces sp.]
MTRSKVTTFLWFETLAAEEAARFYTSIFPDSSIDRVVLSPAGSPLPVGTPMIVEFTLAGVPYIALNGGSPSQFTEAISLCVDCEDQAEIDYYWERLSEGAGPGQCGWIKDKYGLTWQIVPRILPELVSNPLTAGPVMQALRQITKVDIAQLKAAATVQ